MWTKEGQRKWKEQHMHPCIDCGNLCYPHAIRCKKCADKQKRTRIPRYCVDCHKLLLDNSYRAKRCLSCATKFRWKGELREAYNKSKQKKDMLRQGKKYTTTAGYIRIYVLNHPRRDKSGYVLEHILVWEQTNGKYLPKDWIVHHLNGRKSDNRIENLVALPNRKHYLVLQAKAKRIQELEALLNGQGQLV